MLYKKPKNLKYTTMAIFIDEKVAEGNPSSEDMDKIIEYLYHLSFMLAHKHKYFNRYEYYEEFAIWFAYEVLYRLFYNPKLNIKDDNGEYIMKPVKSVLNYMKSIIYGRKCIFEQKFYSQKHIFLDNVHEHTSYDISYKLSSSSSMWKSDVETDIYLKTISTVVYRVVNYKNKYSKDKLTMKYLYISCMLSLINSFIFSERDYDNMNNTYSTPKSKFNHISKKYKDNRDKCVILYKLDKSFYNYVLILVRKVFNTLHDDLVYLTKSNDLCINNDLLSELIYLEIDGERSNY